MNNVDQITNHIHNLLKNKPIIQSNIEIDDLNDINDINDFDNNLNNLNDFYNIDKDFNNLKELNKINSNNIFNDNLSILNPINPTIETVKTPNKIDNKKLLNNINFSTNKKTINNITNLNNNFKVYDINKKDRDSNKDSIVSKDNKSLDKNIEKSLDFKKILENQSFNIDTSTFCNEKYVNKYVDKSLNDSLEITKLSYKNNSSDSFDNCLRKAEKDTIVYNNSYNLLDTKKQKGNQNTKQTPIKETKKFPTVNDHKKGKFYYSKFYINLIII